MGRETVLSEAQDVFVAAAKLARDLQRLLDSGQQDEVANLLAGAAESMVQYVKTAIMERRAAPDLHQLHAILLLHEYFLQRGDFGKIAHSFEKLSNACLSANSSLN